MGQYHYDDKGAFSFFLLTLITLFLIPTTLARIKGLLFPKPEPAHKAKAQQEKKSGLSTGTLIWIGAWILFFIFAYQASQVEHEQQAMWNPYDILEIQPSATDSEIKAAYKRLSLIWHPDKNKGNEQVAEERFVQISKAHLALTDEETRRNWEIYGNPDGRKDVEMGIALPKWIVQKENTAVVLGLYILGLVVIVVTLGRWWLNSFGFQKDVAQRNTSQFASRLQMLQNSKYKPNGFEPFTPQEILFELCIAPEFAKDTTVPEGEQAPPPLADLESIQQEVAKAQIASTTPETKEGGKKKKNVEREESQDAPATQQQQQQAQALFTPPSGLKKDWKRVYTLLGAYFYGIEVPADVQEEIDDVVHKSTKILKSISEAKGLPLHLSGFQSIIQIQQCLVQGIWKMNAKNTQLYMLPGVNTRALQLKTRDLTIRDFLKEKDLQTSLFPDPAALQKALEVAKEIPEVQIQTAKFVVLGEEGFHVGDRLTLKIKFHVGYNGQGPKSDVEDDDEMDYDKEEKQRMKVDHSSLVPAYAPKFPVPKYNSWYVLLANEKNLTIACMQLKEMTTQETKANGTTIRLQIPFSWPKEGKTLFRVWIMSNNFVGVQAHKEIELFQLPPVAKEEQNE